VVGDEHQTRRKIKEAAMDKKVKSIKPYFEFSLGTTVLLLFICILINSTSSCSPKLIPYQEDGDSIVVEKLGTRFYKLQHKDIPLEGEYRVRRPFRTSYDDMLLYNGYLIEITSFKDGNSYYHHVNRKLAAHFGIKL
jgi:hypothetical protein